MRINVLGELRQQIGCVSSTEIEEVAVPVDGLEVQILSGTVNLLRTDQGLLASVAATGVSHEQCSRCLRPVRTPIEINFEEEYVPMSDPNTRATVRVDDPHETFRIGDDFVLDLDEGIRQYVLMAEPAKPLCGPTCAGLCVNCGADLNAGVCNCNNREDARWLPLAALSKPEAEGR